MAVRVTRGGHRPFVGREHELTVAAEILADPDQAGVALIGGESGLGKTRLAEEIIALAPTNITVVRGAAVPRATPIPFELVRSATGLGASDAGSTMADQVRSVAEAIRAAHDGATIFVFEDVHWADPDSLDVIDRLLATGPEASSVLITYRPNALHTGDPASVFLQRAERRSNVAQLRLEPLRRDEVSEYLEVSGRAVDAATVQHVHSRTGGNPLLLSELVAATSSDADLTSGLPWTLAEMLRPEIERLPEKERKVAEAVSVLGAEVGFDLLAAAVNSDERELLSSLRSLVDVGILVESGPDRFSFRHDMVREAVADSLFTREHRAIHAAVHDALLASGSDDVVALVAHATGAGRSKQAADAARDAAAAAFADGHTHQALAFAEQAMLEHTDDVDLLRIAVDCGWRVGQDRNALHHLERWAEVAGSSHEERAEIAHLRVRLQWELENVPAANEAAVELAALIGQMEPSAALAQAMGDLAQHHMLSGEEVEAIAMADRAIEIADAIGPAADAAKRQARAERASAQLTESADRATTIAELMELVDEAEAANDWVVASRALHNVPIQHPLVETASHVERMREAGERAGMSCMATVTYRRYLMTVAQIEGDRATFTSLLEAAVEDMGHNSLIDLVSARDVFHHGDLAHARRIVEHMSPTLESGHYSVSWRSGMLALIDLAEGDAEPLRAWYRELPTRRKAEHFALEMTLENLSVLLDAGLHQEVKSFFDRDIVEGSYEPAFVAIQAELRGDYTEADRLYGDALTNGMCRWVLGQTEMHLARARMADRLGADPAPHLEAAARRIADWPGARHDYVASLIDAPAVDPSELQVLTPREREVARLVEQGLTNGGIADKLFISTKTASVHVSNILSKLAMTSRTEIAAWVARGNLETVPAS